jgi:hypothetical protein
VKHISFEMVVLVLTIAAVAGLMVGVGLWGG